MPVITVSRQYGSLGDEIGKDVADQLGLRFVDHVIIADVAQRLGLQASAGSEKDELEGGLVSDLVRTMRLLYPATRPPEQTPADDVVDDAAYLQIIRQVIWEVARSYDAVIVGRGAAFILPRHPDILHVLLCAPFEVRVERVMAEESLAQHDAEQRVKQIDEGRGRYVRHYYRTNWLDPVHYDLVLNTAHYSQRKAVSLICAAAAPESQSQAESQADSTG